MTADTRSALHGLIRTFDLPLRTELSDHTSLIRSGILDSLALFRLAAWVEEAVGSPIDLTRFDLSQEWDTIADIVAFVERHGGGG